MEKRKSAVFFIYFALAFSTLLVFWQVNDFDFINYDDTGYVYENWHVTSGLRVDNIIWAFKTPWITNWTPLTFISLMLDCQLFGQNPGWMHFVNLLFHLANTLLLFAILRKITNSVWPSAFVAAAFALHPMHVESVAWISERKDVLSTFFGLLALAAYVGYVKNSGLSRYLLALVLFAFSLMTKPMLVTFPFILLLLDYWPLNRFELYNRLTKSAAPRERRLKIRRIIIEKIPFFAMSLVSSMLLLLIQRNEGVVNIEPLLSRIGYALLSYTRYLGKMFWPANLAIVYPPYDSIRFLSALFCAVLLISVSVFVICFGRRQKYLPVGWFWFIGTLIPVIGIVQVGGGRQYFADRYSYLPYIGLFIIVGWGVSELTSKWSYMKKAAVVLVLIVLTWLGISAYNEASYWKDSTTIFTRAIEVTQNNSIAHFSLAEKFTKEGNLVLAIEQYEKALQIAPNYGDALVGLGCAFGRQGKMADAISCFEKALQSNPNFAYAYDNLGVALRNQGKLDEAAVQFERALQISPDTSEFHNNYAKTLMLNGKLDEAVEQFRIALRLKPDWPDPMKSIAWLMATHPEIKNRDVKEALSLALRACELTNYHDPGKLTALAAAYASTGNVHEAIDIAQKALKLAEEANQSDLKNIIKDHLTSYIQGKPYIEYFQGSVSDSNK